MIVADEELVGVLERLHDLAASTTEVADKMPPSYAEMHPVEYVGLRRVAEELRAFNIPECDGLAFRVDRLLTELDETDRIARTDSNSRRCRRQIDRLARAYGQFADAWDRLFNELYADGMKVRQEVTAEDGV